MRTDADRYADLDTHRTRTNRRPDDGSAYDFARAHADQLADGNVVPDLNAVADRLADAGPFAHLELHDHADTVTQFVDDVTRHVADRAHTQQHAAPVGDAGVDREAVDHAFVD